MKKLLIATTNHGKLKEISHELRDLDLELLSLKHYPDVISVQETGKTFEENAILKAKGYWNRLAIQTLADDSGVEIDALNGEPGVKTRRWIHGDQDSTDAELVAYTLERLKGVPIEKRTARLRTVLAFFDGKEMHTVTASIEGVIALEASKEIEPGYPYRALLIISQFGKLYKDLSDAEHKEVNHRLKALRELKPIIIEKLGLD